MEERCAFSKRKQGRAFEKTEYKEKNTRLQAEREGCFLGKAQINGLGLCRTEKSSEI